MRGRIKAVGFIVCSAALLGSAGAAAAAGPYYASSAGSGTACTVGSPCQLNQAVLSGGSSETVLLTNETHTLTSPLNVPGGWTIKPQTAGTRPVITNAGGYEVSLSDPASTIQDVRIDTFNVGVGFWALRLQPGTAKRVEVFSQGGGSAYGAIVDASAQLTDSVVWALGPNSAGVTTAGSGATLRNDTVIANGTSSRGLFTGDSYMVPGDVQTVTIENSIVRGDAASMTASTTIAKPITFNVGHSNLTTPAIDPPAVFNDLGGNQAAAPVFVDPAVTGNFRQVTGSPTINAGAVAAGLSATALDGQARCLGTAPDIGADEFLQSACPIPPATAAPGKSFNLAAAIKKCKKNKKKTPAAKRARKKCIKKAKAKARA